MILVACACARACGYVQMSFWCVFKMFCLLYFVIASELIMSLSHRHHTNAQACCFAIASVMLMVHGTCYHFGKRWICFFLISKNAITRGRRLCERSYVSVCSCRLILYKAREYGGRKCSTSYSFLLEFSARHDFAIRLGECD